MLNRVTCDKFESKLKLKLRVMIKKQNLEMEISKFITIKKIKKIMKNIKLSTCFPNKQT